MRDLCFRVLWGYLLKVVGDNEAAEKLTVWEQTFGPEVGKIGETPVSDCRVKRFAKHFVIVKRGGQSNLQFEIRLEQEGQKFVRDTCLRVSWEAFC